MPSLDTDILDPIVLRVKNELRVATVGRVVTAVRSTGRAAVRFLMTFIRGSRPLRDDLGER